MMRKGQDRKENVALRTLKMLGKNEPRFKSDCKHYVVVFLFVFFSLQQKKEK